MIANNIVEKLEREKKGHEETLALRDSLLRLYKNKDFKNVIEHHFMEKACARYARMSGLSTLNTDARADALSKAQAAGHLQEWMHSIEMMARQAEMSLQKIQDEEAEIRAEALRGEE